MAEFLIALLSAQRSGGGGGGAGGDAEAAAANRLLQPGDVLILIDSGSSPAAGASAEAEGGAGGGGISTARRAATAALNRLTESGYAVEAPADWRGAAAGSGADLSPAEAAAEADAAEGKVLVCCSFGAARRMGRRRLAVVFLPHKSSAMMRSETCPAHLHTGASKSFFIPMMYGHAVWLRFLCS